MQPQSRRDVISLPGELLYPNVFSPIALGPVTAPNRVYMAPHGIALDAPTPGYASREPSVDRVHYFAERAAGGVGTIFHSTQVAPFAGQANLSENPGLAESIPSYARVADAVHEHNAKLMAEIWYVAWSPKRWEALGPEAPALAPSATQQYGLPSTRRKMGREEILGFIRANATATRNLRSAGYDGVELHVSHGALFEYFLSPYFNHRSDEYGGSFEGRLRLLIETLEVMRMEAAGDMAIGIRLTVDEMLPGGYDAEDTKQILGSLAHLIDFVDLDISVEPEQGHLMATNFFEPPLHNASRVAAVTSAVDLNVPILCTPGRVTSVAEAEKLLAAGVVDMVGSARGLIAEPAMINNARWGREHEGRKCIAVNACVDPLGTGWGCAINAAAGKEERWGARTLATPAPRAMRVTVVGGGPAGLEAARVATLRGHSVALIEHRDQVGGGLDLWSRLPGREAVGAHCRWLEQRCRDLGVDISTGRFGDRATVLETNPDVVIIATGSRYNQRGECGMSPFAIPGWDRDFVCGPEVIIRREKEVSGRVVVIDEEGYHAGAGVAEMAAALGAHVQLVTRKPAAGAHLGLATAYVAERLNRAGVGVSTGSFISRIGDHSVTLVAKDEERTIDNVEHVILVTMRDAVDDLYEVLNGHAPYVYLIGDALAPRGLREATYEGHRFARVVGEDSMPTSVLEALFQPTSGVRPAASP
jgi:2,4-dienoyl-CoA reductase-like NADH-dependent reductase (Old Yellow Enzyme family)/thioredoxin reductase